MGEEVLIIGGGPAGTACAMNLIRDGFQPIIIETETFPRYHIGESLTTAGVEALSRLGLDKPLQKLTPPRKRGVHIFSKSPKSSFYVGAGDAWQVERSRFDKMMLDEAVDRGAKLLIGTAKSVERDDDEWIVSLRSDDGDKQLRARFVIDASGQHRFTQKQGLFGEVIEGDYARQISIFSQFEGVQQSETDKHDTLIFHRDKHEWVWMIPLSETVTSIGLVVPVDHFKKDKLPMEDFLEQGIAEFTEPVKQRAHSIRRVDKVRAISNYSFSIDEYCRDGLFCVGDCHRFIDPIFSFGVQFAVVEAEYACKAITACAATNDPSEWKSKHHQYMKVTTEAQDIVQDILSYFWAHPWGFANMAHQRHPEEFLNIFAGRVFELEPGEGVKKMRAVMA
ncbi:MAG: NAD(P)/FAD-dependent oxidoreductase [Candidatus Thiodiazotropha sp.]